MNWLDCITHAGGRLAWRLSALFPPALRLIAHIPHVANDLDDGEAA